MATLVVFKFPTAEGAQTMLSTLASLQKQQLIQIQDGAILTWPAGAKKPKTTQLSDMTGAGALGGAFWGIGWCVLGHAVRLAVLYPVPRPGDRRRDGCSHGTLCSLWDRRELHRPGACQDHARHFGAVLAGEWCGGR